VIASEVLGRRGGDTPPHLKVNAPRPNKPNVWVGHLVTWSNHIAPNNRASVCDYSCLWFELGLRRKAETVSRSVDPQCI